MSALNQFLEEKGLSGREAMVATLVTRGLSNKGIAEALAVKTSTAKFHVTNILSKFQLTSRAQLIVKLLPLITDKDMGAELVK